MAINVTERMYERAWKLLKNGTAYNPAIVSTSNKVILEVSKSGVEDTIKKRARTCSKGIQKEKYNDANFRRRFPKAALSTEINYSKGTLTVVLNLNTETSLADL